MMVAHGPEAEGFALLRLVLTPDHRVIGGSVGGSPDNSWNNSGDGWFLCGSEFSHIHNTQI
jgi:hypothetical protein